MSASSHVVVLYPLFRQRGRAFASGLALVAMGAATAYVTDGHERIVALIVAVLFALLTGLVACKPWLRASGALVLTEDGFRARVLGLSRFVPWSKVSGFFAFAGDTTVGYYRLDKPRRPDDDDDYYDGHLDADAFGMTGPELAALLEQWRQHRGPRPPDHG
jgi:hypothetical protein